MTSSTAGSSGSVTPNQTPQPSVDLWFEDGTIILRAGNTLFKVFKGILVKNSPVFKDMFAMPQPNNVEHLDGCPVVEVYDSADDWRHLLLAIFDIDYLDTHLEDDFFVFVGILRLSVKYDVAPFRDRMIKVANRKWPTTLPEYLSTLPLDKNIEHDLAAASIVHETGLTWCRPAILLNLTKCYTFEQLFESQSQSSLALDDLRRCICARSRISQLIEEEHLAQLLSEYRFAKCADPTQCREARAVAAVAFRFSRIAGHMFPVVFTPELVHHTFRFCEPCAQEFSQFFTNAQSETWDELPDLFGLSGWDILRGHARDIRTP